MLHGMGYDGGTPDADDLLSFDKWLLVNDRPVELLDGQHRVAALKRLVSKTGADKQELRCIAIFTIVVCHTRRQRTGCSVSIATDETAQMRFRPN